MADLRVLKDRAFDPDIDGKDTGNGREFMLIDFFRDNGNQHHLQIPLPVNDETLLEALSKLHDYVKSKI